jgi:rare lipoprotein A
MNRRKLLLTFVTALSLALLAPEAQAGQVRATYVHPSLEGGRTACGTTWDNDAMIVASRTHSCGTRLRLTNPANGASIDVTVRDHSPNSALDLSRKAFSHLAPISQGRVTLNVTRL